MNARGHLHSYFAFQDEEEVTGALALAQQRLALLSIEERHDLDQLLHLLHTVTMKVLAFREGEPKPL